MHSAQTPVLRNEPCHYPFQAEPCQQYTAGVQAPKKVTGPHQHIAMAAICHVYNYDGEAPALDQLYRYCPYPGQHNHMVSHELRVMLPK